MCSQFSFWSRMSGMVIAFFSPFAALKSFASLRCWLCYEKQKWKIAQLIVHIFVIQQMKPVNSNHAALLFSDTFCIVTLCHYTEASAPLKDDSWKETCFIETCKNSNYITEKWIPFGKFDHVLVKMLPSGEAWITASLVCMGIQIPDAYSKLIWYIIQQVQPSK